jgi:hypothetical protein
MVSRKAMTIEEDKEMPRSDPEALGKSICGINCRIY